MTEQGKRAEYVGCQTAAVDRSGSWRTVRSTEARGDRYCDNGGRGRGEDVMRLSFSGDRLVIGHGTSVRGGAATVLVDGDRVGRLVFEGRNERVRFDTSRVFDSLGTGDHVVRVVVTRGRAYLDWFRVRR